MIKTKILVPLLAIAILFLAQPLKADEALAQSKNCLACHQIDKKVIGPAFKDIAAKYKGDAAAPAALVEKIIKGGGGVWGGIPMPPNGNTSQAEAEQLVTWIMSL